SAPGRCVGPLSTCLRIRSPRSCSGAVSRERTRSPCASRRSRGRRRLTSMPRKAAVAANWWPRPAKARADCSEGLQGGSCSADSTKRASLFMRLALFVALVRGAGGSPALPHETESASALGTDCGQKKWSRAVQLLGGKAIANRPRLLGVGRFPFVEEGQSCSTGLLPLHYPLRN